MMTHNSQQGGAHLNSMALVMSYQIMGIHPTALPWAFLGFKNKDMLSVLGEDMLAEELPAKEE